MSQEDKPVAVSSGSTRAPMGLLVIGAGLVLAGWVIFGLVAGEWTPGIFYTALALLVVLSAFGIGGISIGEQTKRVIGWFFGLAAFVRILHDLRYDSFPNDAIDITAYIVFIAGSALMFVGARQLSD